MFTPPKRLSLSKQYHLAYSYIPISSLKNVPIHKLKVSLHREGPLSPIIVPAKSYFKCFSQAKSSRKMSSLCQLKRVYQISVKKQWYHPIYIRGLHEGTQYVPCHNVSGKKTKHQHIHSTKIIHQDVFV